MTPKERARAALSLKEPDDIVPTMEIEFHLHRALTGNEPVLGGEFGKLTGKARERAIAQNVEIYSAQVELLDYSSVTIDPLYWEFGHGVGTRFYYPCLQDQIDVAKRLYAEIGDKAFVAVSMDSTFGIPLSENFEAFIMDMYEQPDSLLKAGKKNLEKMLEGAKKLIDAGVGVFYCCSDYCFGTSSFFSREQFERFVFPFLKEQTEALKQSGAYVIKHTDGNINQILDMILDSAPHALHSIDPMAGMDIASIKTQIGDRICIMGNVDASVLERGPKDAIERSAEYALKSAMPGGGYIFSTCNTVFEAIPYENYRIMLDVRKRLGLYNRSTEPIAHSEVR